jgi:hypothetical protein
VAAAREARVIAGLAALEGRHEKRDPADALLGATHDADRILQQLKASLSAGDVQPSAMLSIVGEWVDRVARLAKVVIDTRIDLRRVELDAERLQLVRVAVGRAIGAADLDPGQRARFLRVLAAGLRVEAEDRQPSVRIVPELES